LFSSSSSSLRHRSRARKDAKEVLLRSLPDIIALTDFILQQPGQADCEVELFDLKKLSITCCLNWTTIQLNFVYTLFVCLYFIIDSFPIRPFDSVFFFSSPMLTCQAPRAESNLRHPLQLPG
jgi:hypothetical protein